MRLLDRQKLLLKLIGRLQAADIISRRAIVKSLFLLKKEYSIDKYIKAYSFYPYKQGPFSELCFSDLRKLKTGGLVDERENRLTEAGSIAAGAADIGLDEQISQLMERFRSERALTAYVYSTYPEFTVKSQLTGKKEQEAAEGFCTIGYEGKDIDSFLNMLIQNGITCVIDVRKNAFSMNFTFTKGNLERYLSRAGIAYIHVPELGVESRDRKNLDSQEDYEKLFAAYRRDLPNKKGYLDRIGELGKKKKIALMCFEKDVNSCHRREIAAYLQEKGAEVAHL